MPFCGKCGAPLNGEETCPNCGAKTESTPLVAGGAAAINSPKKTGLWKIIIAAALIIAVMVWIFTSCSSTVDVPCDWCGKTPSVAYQTSDGSDAYVCKDCSKVCALCGEKATKHYENLLGMVIFVCNDCYGMATN
ncbi:hypothetical protein WGC32_02695 [Zongyangia sp. HA2173]|uniref:hypothetical protein n=1 Tax=Zongyangia sp. HA2173 TaxID=3133035 RepID=UPI003168238F